MGDTHPDLLHHLALASEWEAAGSGGVYEISTLGRTLAQEGFIHLSLTHQLARVAESFYAGVDEPLMLLTIDPSLLTAPVRWEPGDATDPAGETFPHLYGPLPVRAVVAAQPARLDGGRFVVEA